MNGKTSELEVEARHCDEQPCGTLGTHRVADFDRVAGAYRWMEYLSLGTMLEKVRWWALDEGWLDSCRSALILGDGDGRFTARLMARNRSLRVNAVDASAAMLRLLSQRCAPFAERLTTRCGDARVLPLSVGADLVVTHFFLDCLEEHEVRALVQRIADGLTPEALWIVSEFRVPAGILRWPARLLVRGLYLAFRVLTGLKVTQLPQYEAALERAGFRLVREQSFLGGILLSQAFRFESSAQNSVG